MEHLNLLTVQQLHQLKKEHGLSAAGNVKADLVAKLADRLDRGRRNDGSPLVGMDRKYSINSEGLSEDVLDKVAIPLRHLPLIIGAPDGSDVGIESHIGANGVAIIRMHVKKEYDEGDLSATRTIAKTPDGDLIMVNNIIKIPAVLQREGLGGKIVFDQIKNASQSGIKEIRALAARGGSYIGWKVWPKFGYDAPIPFDELKSKGTDVEHIKNAKTIQDLYKTPDGQKWWEDNGITVNMTFDLAPGSLSMKIHDEYRTNWQLRRGIKLESQIATASQNHNKSLLEDAQVESMLNPTTPEEPCFSREELEIMDASFDKIRCKQSLSESQYP